MNSKKIGQFISELRKEQGLKQQELAEMLSVTDKAVSKWETGRGIPDISIIQELAGVLGVSVEELLNGEKNKNTEIATPNNDEKIIKKLKIKKYIRLAIELIVTVLFICWIFIFRNTIAGYANVLDMYLHKDELMLLMTFFYIFLAGFAVWVVTVLISLLLKRKASVIKTIIICLSVSFLAGASIKMAELDDAKIVMQYDTPVDTVDYVKYDAFFDGAFDTQITIKNTNDIITENYSAYFDHPDGDSFVYTNCVTTNDKKLTDKYYDEETELATLNAEFHELDGKLCKECGIDKGIYITGLYFDNSVNLYFVKDKSYYSIVISDCNISDKELINQISTL